MTRRSYNRGSKLTELVINEANYLTEHKSTIRDVANHFLRSKSTVYVDLRYRLRTIPKEYLEEIGYNPSLYDEVFDIIETNKSQCYERGIKKYQESKKNT